MIKKFLSTVLIVAFVFCSAISFAGQTVGDQQWAAPVVGTAGVVAQAGTSYSAVVNVADSEGYMAALITTTAGSITITQQASLDGTTFYDVESSSANAMGAVTVTMTVGTKYLQFAPVFAPYMRFKVTEGNVAATVVTIKVLIKR